MALLASCDSPSAEEPFTPLTAVQDTDEPMPSLATRVADVEGALERLRTKDPSLVATWDVGGAGVQYLSGRIHGPDPRLAKEIARDMVLEHGSLFGIDGPGQLREQELEISPKTGTTHVFYEQVLGGYPIVGRGLSVHVAADGSVMTMNGRSESGLSPQMLGPVKTTARDVENEVRRVHHVEGEFERFTEPRLVVSLHGEMPTLVWQTSVFAEGFDGGLELEVDATTGRIHHSDTVRFGIAATGCDPFGRTVDINTTHPIAFPYQLHDKTRPTKIRAYDQGGSEIWTNSSPFTDTDNDWCDGDPLQAAAVAGHSNMAAVLDYFDDHHGRNGYDDSGGNIKMGYDALIAFPQGLTQNSAMSFPGGTFTFGSAPFTVIDVIGHEFTHLVLLEENVTYTSREGQATHEHVADAFGAFVEREVGNSNGVWNLVMAEGTVLERDLRSPPGDVDHFSEFDDQDGVQWNNSLIPGYAFAMLVDGGVHPQSGVEVSAVDLDDLADIYYEAVTAYMSPGEVSFIELREALAAAAGDLFGQHSSQQNSVRAAFIAVGITPTTFNLVAWADDFQIWNEWGASEAFGTPHASPGVGFTSAKMEDGKLFDGEMMGFTPGGGGFGHIAGEYQLRLPEVITIGAVQYVPHLQAEIGFPLIAVDDDEAQVLLRLEDADGSFLHQEFITVRRDDATVDVVDWDLQAFADRSVTLRVNVINTGTVPSRPVMFDSLRIVRLWQ